jgi:hypothetical protein
MRKKISIVSIVFCLLFVSVSAVPSLAGENPGDRAYTPRPGSAERKAILDALRAWVTKQHHMDVVFVVRHLKVKNGYAWVHTLPQSRDGSSRYEDISALMKKVRDVWSVAEIPCAEEENPDCIGDPEYFDGLKKRFPDVPGEILPRP